MIDSLILAERLKSARESAGLSREDVAMKVGVSVSAVGMYETGERVPRDGVKVSLAALYQTTVQALFFD